MQPLSGENMNYNSAITEDNARLDIKASGFMGGNYHTTYFDVRVFNPLAASSHSANPASIYQKHKRRKREPTSKG